MITVGMKLKNFLPIAIVRNLLSFNTFDSVGEKQEEDEVFQNHKNSFVRQKLCQNLRMGLLGTTTIAWKKSKSYL